MKSIIKNYTFSTSGKTVTLTNVATIRLDRLALITDVTTNQILYNFADPTVATATVATNVITLSAVPVAANNADKLQIIYDLDIADAAFGDSTNAAELMAAGAAVSVTNPVAQFNGAPASSTATWTSATSINTALTNSSALGYGTATVTTIETGTTTTAGALTFEVYDGTNWWAVTGQQIGSYVVQSAYTLVNATNVAWTFDIAGFQGFRVRLSTAITGTGSPQVVVIMQLQAAPNDITPSVGWAQKLDQVNDAITAYPFGHSFLNITTNATTTVKSGAGVFKGFTVNNNGFTTAGTITIYDNTAGSGTKIGTWTIPISPPGTALLATDLMPPILGLDLAFSTGLTFVTATTAPAADISVIYR